MEKYLGIKLVSAEPMTRHKFRDSINRPIEDGLDDCLYQVEYCTKCYKAIKGDEHE